ncbi:uncharacterized protein F4807DRAFT_51344 [Annulohypoxylon truncatum]|uniref:uncharacterized protein n=1 Tax=Annulohypoxylon truncatum TaxID=327061 RepID=UPI0020077A0B|nr:uncharacterized protein F4807DRAFT_51344 [Annulohypoxylon truncatum]KAI1210532.1 hypothetical protein F4807DRAFT_51344 [Annulohypoxylon truncatum]
MRELGVLQHSKLTSCFLAAIVGPLRARLILLPGDRPRLHVRPDRVPERRIINIDNTYPLRELTEVSNSVSKSRRKGKVGGLKKSKWKSKKSKSFEKLANVGWGNRREVGLTLTAANLRRLHAVAHMCLDGSASVGYMK